MTSQLVNGNGWALLKLALKEIDMLSIGTILNLFVLKAILEDNLRVVIRSLAIQNNEYLLGGNSFKQIIRDSLSGLLGLLCSL